MARKVILLILRASTESATDYFQSSINGETKKQIKSPHLFFLISRYSLHSLTPANFERLTGPLAASFSS